MQFACVVFVWKYMRVCKHTEAPTVQALLIHAYYDCFSLQTTNKKQNTTNMF